MANDNIILWGIGKHCMRLMQEYLFPVRNIEIVIDSNKNLWGTKVPWGGL